ncbi:glycoside hydrolase family 43 protein [Streptomyces lonarensis]|uniref:Glycoside hydrolase family 43 protein n=1 Tax=Streptomyces lonarensis TaxID=700599 RepID=A0A7X6CYX0_9ACTN|nr:glycoside hydrolase family 43 protein [Streptomyces lonarensis]
MVRNPVLPGSHPDPSAVVVGGRVHLATSTFEWSPGVRLHRSADLVRWEPLGGVLGEERLLRLEGSPDSGGVWAPNLTWADGLFHLVYSNVSTYAGGFTDCPNQLTVAADPAGPWSDPVPLHARGFDPSLFHDGPTSWLLNLVHDWRPGRGGSAGLEITRYDRAARRLVGEPQPVRLRDRSGWVEGPHLFRRGDHYYLVTADGGTGRDHRVVVARSRQVTGPYTADPAGPLLTARGDPDLPLQRAGHGSFFTMPDGRSWLAYLASRPLGPRGSSILGRETAVAPVVWTADGWPRVPGGRPAVTVTHPLPAPVASPAKSAAPSPPPAPAAAAVEVDDFDGPRLGPQWSTLRRHADTRWLSLTARRSHLRISGGRSPQSLVGPSLVGRRVPAPRAVFEARVEFRPLGFQHLAGVTLYYNTRNWYFLHLTADDAGRTVVRSAACDRGVTSTGEDLLALDGAEGPVDLALELDGPLLHTRARAAGRRHGPGLPLDATVTSDEHVEETDRGGLRTLGFTGAFFGLWVWDLTGAGRSADIDRAALRTCD